MGALLGAASKAAESLEDRHARLNSTRVSSSSSSAVASSRPCLAWASSSRARRSTSKPSNASRVVNFERRYAIRAGSAASRSHPLCER